MTDLKKVKKKIAENWIDRLPDLFAFKQNKFYKIIGPVICGIELIKLPRSENYSPYFVIYPLWKDNLKECLEVPIVFFEIKDRKMLQFNIPFSENEDYLIEAVDCLNKQVSFSLTGNLSIDKLKTFIEKLLATPPLSASQGSYLQGRLYEFEFKIALYLGKNQLIVNSLKEIAEKKWNEDHFAIWGIKYDDWFNNLREEAINRSAFLRKIEQNRQNVEIKKLRVSELTF